MHGFILRHCLNKGSTGMEEHKIKLLLKIENAGQVFTGSIPKMKP